MKGFLLLAAGLALGYTLGFNDAQIHEKPLGNRIVERVGSHHHDELSTGADRALHTIDQP